MANDVRTSRSAMSDFVLVDDGDSGPFGVLELRDEETLSMDRLRIQYSSDATDNITLTIYDEDYDTDDVTDGDEVDSFLLTPGDTLDYDDVTYEDVYYSVVMHTENDHDGQVVVSVGGMKVTG